MNIFFIILSLICLNNFNNIFTECVRAKIDAINERTFFRPRSTIEDAALFLAMNNYRIYQKYLDIPIIADSGNIDRDENFYFHSALFFENSKKSQEFKKYFYPNGLITNSNTLINDAQNYLICPIKETVGVILNYHQDFCFVENLWVNAKFAIYRSKNSFLLECKDCCGKQSNFLKKLNFEKISLCPLKKIGIDDIQIDIGYTIYNSIEDANYFNIYGTILLPTASKPKADFVFEPLVGRGHWGLGMGINGGLKIFENLKDKRYIALMGDLSYQYLFSGCEFRLIRPLTNFNHTSNEKILNELNDLSEAITSELNYIPQNVKNKISSIKLNFLENNLTKLTKQKFKVTPESLVNLWLALHYQHYSWNIELGYNLWWKDAEKVCLTNCLNINEQLNLASVAQPSALTNKIYAVTGYFTTLANHTIPIFFGASYEFTKDKNALEQWQVWLGAEFSF